MKKETKKKILTGRLVITVVAFLLALIAIIYGFALTSGGSIATKDKADSAKSNNELAENISSICSTSGSWRDCYGKQLANLNYRINLEKTLQVLERLKVVDEKTRDCHLIAHWISISEVEKSPNDWINIFNFVDQTTCNNGFVHGVMEGRSRFDPSLVLDTRTISETCKLIDSKTSSRLGLSGGGSDDACGHIIGHILLAEKEGKIPETVKVCDALPQNLRTSCLQGVFMENITRENLEIHGVAKKIQFTAETAKEFENICNEYNGDIGKNCWRELSHIFTSLSKNKPQGSYDFCYLNSNKDYAFECYLHAVNLIIMSPGYSDRDLENTCKNYWDNSDRLTLCMSRALGSLINSSVGFIDRAESFCAYIPSANKDRCYNILGSILKKKVSESERIKLCGGIPSEYQQYCLN